MIAAPKPYPPTAYSLFLRGLDTLEIGKRLKMPEADVLRAITQQRAAAKGLTTRFQASPYKQSRVKDWVKSGNPALGHMR